MCPRLFLEGRGGVNLIISIDSASVRSRRMLDLRSRELSLHSIGARALGFTLGRAMISFIISIKPIDKFCLPNVSITWKWITAVLAKIGEKMDSEWIMLRVGSDIDKFIGRSCNAFEAIGIAVDLYIYLWNSTSPSTSISNLFFKPSRWINYSTKNMLCTIRWNTCHYI